MVLGEKGEGTMITPPGCLGWQSGLLGKLAGEITEIGRIGASLARMRGGGGGNPGRE